MIQNDLLQLLHDIKQFDIQNLALDLPQDIRARIKRALVGWGELTPDQKSADARRLLEVQVADFISQRTRRLIQAYQDGDSVAATAATLLAAQPAQQHSGLIHDHDHAIQRKRFGEATSSGE